MGSFLPVAWTNTFTRKVSTVYKESSASSNTLNIVNRSGTVNAVDKVNTNRK